MTSSRPEDSSSDVDFGDDDFDALGFDTQFAPGADPVSAFAPLGDDDDTPPGGIYMGEALQVLDAHAVGKALAEASGEKIELPPDLEPLQQGLVGIDFGASHAVVACFNAHGKHEIVPNEHDERITPAHIFFDDDGEQLVGREAGLMAPSAPERAVIGLKEVLSDPDYRFQPGPGQDLTGEDVLAIVIGRLLADVENHTGERATHVSLAAPAWFGEQEREVLQRAVERHGVVLVGITDEALAAAVPYSLRLEDLSPRLALVFDHGHAALGVAVVRCAGGDIEVLAKGARRDLGSHQLDRLIAREAARKFQEAHGFDPLEDPGARLDLELRAEEAKRDLSRRPQCRVVVQSRGKTYKVGFTRRGFEEAARRLVEGAVAFARHVRDQARIEDWSGFDAVIMTGGGSRTPLLRRLLEEEVGREPETMTHEEGVAIGALYWGIGERHRKSLA